MGIEVSGVFAVIVLILDLWAIISVLGSSAPTGAKVLWVLLILLLPIIGMLVWLLVGPRSNSATTA